MRDPSGSSYLVKFGQPYFDFGLTTDTIEPVAAFWRDEIGLPLNQLLPPGHILLRYDLHGSVLKFNALELQAVPLD